MEIQTLLFDKYEITKLSFIFGIFYDQKNKTFTRKTSSLVYLTTMPNLNCVNGEGRRCLILY